MWVWYKCQVVGLTFGKFQKEVMNAEKVGSSKVIEAILSETRSVGFSVSQV